MLEPKPEQFQIREPDSGFTGRINRIGDGDPVTTGVPLWRIQSRVNRGCSRCQSYKTFYGRDLRIFEIS